MARHAERAARAAARNAAGCRRRRSWRVRGRSSWLTWHVRCTRSRCGRRRRRISVRPPVPLSLARSPLLPPSLAPASARRVVRCASHSACRLACCVQARFARTRSRCSLTHTHTRTHARTPTRTQVLVDARWRGWAAQLKALAWVRHTPARARGEAFASPHRPRRPVAFGSFLIQRFRAFGCFLHSDGRFRRCARCWRCCWTAACGASALRRRSRTKA